MIRTDFLKRFHCNPTLKIIVESFPNLTKSATSNLRHRRKSTSNVGSNRKSLLITSLTLKCVNFFFGACDHIRHCFRESTVVSSPKFTWDRCQSVMITQECWVVSISTLAVMKCSGTSRLPRSFKTVKGEMKNEKVFQFFIFIFWISGQRRGGNILKWSSGRSVLFFWSEPYDDALF